jgi:hypothetical protein
MTGVTIVTATNFTAWPIAERRIAVPPASGHNHQDERRSRLPASAVFALAFTSDYKTNVKLIISKSIRLYFICDACVGLMILVFYKISFWHNYLNC